MQINNDDATEVPDGSVVKASVSRTWNVLSIVDRSWVWTTVWSNFACIALLVKSYLNQKYNFMMIHAYIYWEPLSQA